MGMIIKNHIQKLMKGYPTVSDKYNVAGATLGGSDPVYFGDLVKFGSDGLYEAITSTVTLADIAGFVLATNVKLAESDDVTVPTKPGEQFNLALGGNTYMAIALASGADATDIAPNGQVYVDLDTGKCTTDSGETALPGVVFTGVYEEVAGELLAEILIK